MGSLPRRNRSGDVTKPKVRSPIAPPATVVVPKKMAKIAGVSRRQILPFVSVQVIGPTGKRRMEKRPK
jgi:hypothetical protein